FNNMSLLVFRGVPAGDAHLVMRGTLWENVDLPVHVEAGSTSFIDEPLVLTPASSIAVSWRGERRDVSKTAMIALLRCSGTGDDQKCDAVTRRDLPSGANSGEVTFAGLIVGAY